MFDLNVRGALKTLNEKMYQRIKLPDFEKRLRKEGLLSKDENIPCTFREAKEGGK